MKKRTTEFVLGLIGGIIGFFGAILALMFGGIGSAFGADGASSISNLGWSAIIFSILGIVGAAIVNSKTKLSGWLMLVSAIGGVISISLFYLLPFVLLFIAGLMALLKKDKQMAAQ
jgi:hypothetical protein